MNTAGIRTIVRKELRSYFLSPVALIFLAVFLVAVLVDFFFLSAFFSRNLADVRPLFASLPFLLIFLVSAVTMRQWSEEQKMGTLEVLLTLPLKTSHLVLSKFAAGMVLVALALAFTLALPITVAQLGDLDMGPVVGGYVAALLLASTYMAIGLCVSAKTDNQIVALMVTATICAVMYALGADAVTKFVGNETGEFLRSLGTGSRFSSIERGVLDLRDLLYYGSLTVFFLVLNTYFLETKRMEKQPAEGDSRRGGLLVTIALAGLNAVAVNIWLAPVTSARVDLTADGEYSISEVTEGVLAELDEPLIIAGYFSERTHPKLAELVPRIRDFLREYEIRGSGNVNLVFANPATDEELEREIQEQYGIKSFPFQVTGRHEQAVVNSFFHVLIKYGDEFEVLSFMDLVEVHTEESNIQVRLRNLEYDVTRSIKRVTEGFQSIEAALAANDQSVKVTAYISPASLPPEFAEIPSRMDAVVKSLTDKAGGRLTFEQHDPTGDAAMQERLFRRYGFRPMSTDLFSKSRYYLYFVVESGESVEPVFLQSAGETSEAELEAAIEAAIRRMTPGYLRVVGILTQELVDNTPNIPGLPKQPEKTDYRILEQILGSEYDVRRLKFEDTVPPAIDVLIVGKPGPMTEKHQFAIDQYLMRGGALIALAGAYEIKPPEARRWFSASRIDDSFLDLLQAYGVTVEQKLVMDPKNIKVAIPKREQVGPFVRERVELVPYPLFPDIRRQGYNESHVAMGGVPNVLLTWASPLTLAENLPEGVKGEILLRSSPDSWLKTDSNIEPASFEFDEEGVVAPADAEIGPQPVAVTLEGVIPSFFADKPSPLFEPNAKDDPEANPSGDRTGRTLKQSTPNARLVVVGSSAFISDPITQQSAAPGGGVYRGNAQLMGNLVDWALADTEMLKIRSSGAFARTLRTIKPAEATRYEFINYAIGLLAILAVWLLTATRRRMTQPIISSGKGGKV